MTSLLFSIIIPAFNERENISLVVERAENLAGQ
jgi:glycosyltransferase involved in cell wall biosynthesis